MSEQPKTKTPLDVQKDVPDPSVIDDSILVSGGGSDEVLLVDPPTTELIDEGYVDGRGIPHLGENTSGAEESSASKQQPGTWNLLGETALASSDTDNPAIDPEQEARYNELLPHFASPDQLLKAMESGIFTEEEEGVIYGAIHAQRKIEVHKTLSKRWENEIVPEAENLPNSIDVTMLDYWHGRIVLMERHLNDARYMIMNGSSVYNSLRGEIESARLYADVLRQGEYRQIPMVALERLERLQRTAMQFELDSQEELNEVSDETIPPELSTQDLEVLYGATKEGEEIGNLGIEGMRALEQSSLKLLAENEAKRQRRNYFLESLALVAGSLRGTGLAEDYNRYSPEEVAIQALNELVDLTGYHDLRPHIDDIEYQIKRAVSSLDSLKGGIEVAVRSRQSFNELAQESYILV